MSSRTVNLDGRVVHYLIDGNGPVVILLHGFPQSAYEFHAIMPRLAKRFTVVAADLRGVDGSIGPGPYDTASMAEDIHRLTQKLKLKDPYIVGHDIGGMVAYAYARLYPDETRGVMILDVPLPGIDPWESLKHNPVVWHFGFHQTPKLPEQLISGREFLYFRSFFDRFMVNQAAVSDDDVKRYVNSYAAADQLAAGLGFYRAFGADEAFDRAQRTTITVPFVIAAGDHAIGPLLEKIAAGLKTQGCTNVTTKLIEQSGHFVVDEKPEEITQLIEDHAAVN